MASLSRACEARTSARVIGVSVGMFVCVFVATKPYYAPVRNRKILASTWLTNESVLQEAEKSRLLNFSALLKLLFNIVDPYQLPQHK